jgi:hypothetical protein
VEFNPAGSGKRLRADPEFVIRYPRSFRDAQTARNLSLTRRFANIGGILRRLRGSG